MTKFHINSQGKPAICKAKKGNCPFGGYDSHYSSLEKAQEAADKQNEKEFNLLPDKSVNSEKNDEKSNATIFARKIKKSDRPYVEARKEFLRNESPAPTYIEKVSMCKKIKNAEFYEKERNVETEHFDFARRGRIDKLESIYGEGETVGFYEVNHKVKGSKFKWQVIEIKSTGQLIVYDKENGKKVTSFMGHRARIETMMILAGEIPYKRLLENVHKNHTADLKRQSIDKKYGLQ